MKAVDFIIESYCFILFYFFNRVYFHSCKSEYLNIDNFVIFPILLSKAIIKSIINLDLFLVLMASVHFHLRSSVQNH